MLASSWACFFWSFFKVVAENWHEGGGESAGDEEVKDEIGNEKGGVVGVGSVGGAEVCRDEAVAEHAGKVAGKSGDGENNAGTAELDWAK